MLRFRGRLVRRVTAVLVSLGLGLFTTEAWIPDVHDGDATAAELAAAGVNPHQVGDLPAPSNESTTPVPDDVDHSTHVCHCTHGHGGPVTSFDLGLRLVAHSEPVPSGAPAGAPEVDPEPQIRPPIA